MHTISRRQFLGSCAGHLAAAAAFVPAAQRRTWAQESRGRIVAREPFGYLEEIGERTWALVSTPLQGQRTTLCNGGIIAGRTAVLAIEGFYEPAGAAWLASQARELTGRWPTHVVLTHYHADHTNGVAGYRTERDRPVVRATDVSRELVLQKNQPTDPARAAALGDMVAISVAEPTLLDVGGRQVRIVPRRGHTPSDLSIEVTEPAVVFCGDLVWNGMFPNYVDATPIQLAQSVRDLRRDAAAVYVPGHGALARLAEFDRYVAVLEEVERGARRAHAQGISAAEAGARFALPPALGEWALFNPVFFERAFAAWYAALAAPPAGPR